MEDVTINIIEHFGIDNNTNDDGNSKNVKDMGEETICYTEVAGKI